jgi:hypothetical protein
VFDEADEQEDERALDEKGVAGACLAREPDNLAPDRTEGPLPAVQVSHGLDAQRVRSGIDEDLDRLPAGDRSDDSPIDQNLPRPPEARRTCARPFSREPYDRRFGHDVITLTVELGGGPATS